MDAFSLKGLDEATFSYWARLMAEEMRDSRRDLSRGLLLGVSGVVALYLAANFVCVKVLGPAWARFRSNELARWVCACGNSVVLGAEGQGATKREVLGSPSCDPPGSARDQEHVQPDDTKQKQTASLSMCM